MRKKFMTNFAKAFIIQDQGSEHWIPWWVDNGPLFKCMDEIIDDRFLESPGSRLRALKHMYCKGDPVKCTKRLPRIRVHQASQCKKNKERVTAFVGWRFPFPGDIVEVDIVKKWLNTYEGMLKVSVSEATDICLRICGSYEKKFDKYIYSDYPLVPKTTQTEFIPPIHEDDNTAEAVTEEVTDGLTEEVRDRPSQETQESFTRDLTQAEKLKNAEEIMRVARHDVFYRSLKVAFFTSCPVRLDILCTAWTSLHGNLSEDWCGLQREIFEYCQLTASGEVNTSRHRQLKLQLSDEFEVFRMVRRSAGLPLNENDSTTLE